MAQKKVVASTDLDVVPVEQVLESEIVCMEANRRLYLAAKVNGDQWVWISLKSPGDPPQAVATHVQLTLEALLHDAIARGFTVWTFKDLEEAITYAIGEAFL